MKRRWLAIAVVLGIAASALFGFMWLVESEAFRVSPAVLAAPDQLSITAVDPNSAANDLDTSIVVSGTGFTAEMSGTQVITSPIVYLGSSEVLEVLGVESTTISAIVPWGMDPGVYTLTVENLDGGVEVLTEAFTVTEGVGVWNAGELYGGTVSDVLINPDDPEKIYAETQSIGLFSSDDAGGSWDFKYASTADNTVIDPQSPDHIYLHGNPHQPGHSLWRSLDAGESWTPITTTVFPITETQGRYCWATEGVKPYIVSGTLYASACGHGGQFSGLIRSYDQGDHWEPAMGGLTDTQVTDLAFHPTDPLTMYLGTANGNVFISVNGGTTWTFASRPVGYVHELGVNPFGKHEVWIAAETFFGDPPGVLKSTNADLTEWTSVAPPDDVGYIDNFFAFAPKAWGDHYSGTVFVASGHKTTDGGENWSTYGPENDWIYDFTPHPTHTQTLYAAVNEEGVYKTSDDGGTWQVVNRGLTGIVPNVLQSVPGQPDTVYAYSELQFRLYKATQGGAVWQTLPITRVNSILVDPITTTRIYAGSDRGIYISGDGGQTWPTYVQIGPPVEYEDHYWYWPTALSAHPDQPGEMIAGLTHKVGGYTAWTGSLYYSTDWGQMWTQGFLEPNQPISNVRDIARDPISPTIVYAATGYGGTDEQGPLLRSTDSGRTWTFLDLKGVIAIEVEPGTHRVYIPSHPICDEEGQTSGLCFSDDFGETWEPAGENPGGIGNITFTSSEPPTIYADTDQGLLKSIDRGATWSLAEGVLGHVPIYAVTTAEAEDRTILYAATTGGYVESDPERALSLENESDTLANAGVYRFTRLLTWELYLPLLQNVAVP